jgi:hypothetical protein
LKRIGLSLPPLIYAQYGSRSGSPAFDRLAPAERAYDNFYPRYPLDGHKSDAAELLLFEKHASRVALHREIWEQILTKVTGDEHLSQQATVAVGFIGSTEAVRRIQALMTMHLRV